MRPDFLVVGSARSGTTLLQRLLTDLDGVVIPEETHLFTRHWPALVRLRLVGTDAGAKRVLAAAAHDAHLPPPAAASGGRSPAALFDRLLAGVDGSLVGEKTPGHLRWLDVLWRERPDLPVVALVRHPQAVAASYLAAPFGTGSAAAVAHRWVVDQRTLRAHLGAGRPVHVVRYEDLVTDPAPTLARAAAHIGAPPPPSTPIDGVAEDRGLFTADEWWKARALEAPDRSRVDGWRALSAPALDMAGRVAAEEASRWGYDTRASDARHAVLDPARLRLMAGDVVRAGARRIIARRSSPGATPDEGTSEVRPTT